MIGVLHLSFALPARIASWRIQKSCTTPVSPVSGSPIKGLLDRTTWEIYEVP